MQINNVEYNAELHEQYKCLSIPQPIADWMTKLEYIDDNGEFHARKEVEIRSRDVNYRGDVLICSSKFPEVVGCDCGVTLGIVELYDVKHVSDFTDEDWAKTALPKSEWGRKTGYGYFFRNPRPVVEMPVRGMLGFYKITLPKGDITPYPRYLEVGEREWKKINRKNFEKK